MLELYLKSQNSSSVFAQIKVSVELCEKIKVCKFLTVGSGFMCQFEGRSG